MKSFFITIVLLFINLMTSNPLASTSRAMQDDKVPDTCEGVAAELVGFKDALTEWGQTPEGDPLSSTRNTSAAGEWFVEAVVVYKTTSRFKKRVREINKDIEGVTSRTRLLDEKGREIGKRVVQERRVAGKVTRVFILRITERMIQTINAPSLKLGLTIEKAKTCRTGRSAA